MIANLHPRSASTDQLGFVQRRKQTESARFMIANVNIMALQTCNAVNAWILNHPWKRELDMTCLMSYVPTDATNSKRINNRSNKQINKSINNQPTNQPFNQPTNHSATYPTNQIKHAPNKQHIHSDSPTTTHKQISRSVENIILPHAMQHYNSYMNLYCPLRVII